VLAWRAKPLRPGARLGLRPGHMRLTFNLHDTVWLVRDWMVVDQLPIAARGRSQ
jgi:D-serine deaminase-like pyridoxal phosphate-dependent protein